MTQVRRQSSSFVGLHSDTESYFSVRTGGHWSSTLIIRMMSGCGSNVDCCHYSSMIYVTVIHNMSDVISMTTCGSLWLAPIMNITGDNEYLCCHSEMLWKEETLKQLLPHQLLYCSTSTSTGQPRISTHSWGRESMHATPPLSILGCILN